MAPHAVAGERLGESADADPSRRYGLEGNCAAGVLDRVRAASGCAEAAGRADRGPSGTQAALWTLSYFRHLTAHQQRVVERRLGVRVAGRGARAAFYDDPGLKADPTIRSLAGAFVLDYEPLLPHTLGLKIIGGVTTSVITDPNNPKGVVLADSTQFNAQGDWGSGTPTTCRVRVTPAGQAKTSTFIGLLVAHEVFHCFQADILGTAAWSGPPAWIREGTADWAALSADPVSFSVPRVERLSVIATICWPSTIGISSSSWSRKRIRSNWLRVFDGIASTSPSWTFRQANRHRVPFLVYSCSRRAGLPGCGGWSGLIGALAWIPVFSSIDTTST
ncbi:MAG: hypothetical protein WBP81_14295, partial [Solirubrobacteraceae bacterium]